MAKTKNEYVDEYGNMISKKEIIALELAKAKKRKKLRVKILIASISILLAVSITLAFVLPHVLKREDWVIGNPFPIATIEIEGYGILKFELRPDKAPETVRNFIMLAESGFYDGSLIYRICPNLMMQTGENIDGKTTYAIPGEMTVKFPQNDLKHTEGAISMARMTPTNSDNSNDYYYNSATSDFFVMEGVKTEWDKEFAVFGYLTGTPLEVDKQLLILRAITHVDGDEGEWVVAGGKKPSVDIVIKSITIDRKGVEYLEPKKSKIKLK